jgi:membrane-bound inhibitor of C-type lysozyme
LRHVSARKAEGKISAASGARYANKDETFVFWNKGDTAFVTEGKDGKETYSGCATK